MLRPRGFRYRVYIIVVLYLLPLITAQNLVAVGWARPTMREIIFQESHYRSKSGSFNVWVA